MWETGFWNSIFGQETFGNVLEQQFQRPIEPPFVAPDLSDSVESAKKQRILDSFPSSIPLAKSCIKSTSDDTWQEIREMQLQRALKHWAVLIESWEPSVSFVQMVLGCESINAQLILLGDVFRRKAPGTLLKRANSLRILNTYLNELGLLFPCSEPLLYTFICDLRDKGFPPSRAKGVLEAIGFVRHTMDIEECQPLLAGRRCWGAASDDTVKHRNQASPLKVKELEVLHAVLNDDPDIWNRAFSGMALFVTYSRARWSDAQHSSALLFDKDANGHIAYVEAATGSHKTIQSLQHRHQFLPLVAPAVGVTTDNWAETWMTVRKELGLVVGANCPLLPVPLEDGAPGRRMVSSEEASKWLKGLILRQLPIEEDRKISSHSMKVCTLAMLAKRGVRMEDRLMLGYHSSPFQMGLTYSRDGMARPLMILENMLSEIRSGKFQPDVTRSGRLSNADASGFQHAAKSRVKIEIEDDENGWRFVEPRVEQYDDQLPQGLPEALPSCINPDLIDICTESSCSEGESDTPGDEFDDAGGKTFAIPSAPPGYVMWQHSKSKILHLMSVDHRSIFECGRKAGAFHTNENVHPRWDSGICWKCFKHV